MRPHRNRAAISFTATFSQVTNQLLTRVELGAGWLIAVEIAYQANSKRDVVQEIAMHVATVNLTSPSIADLDFAVAGGRAVADHEMISQSILHASDPAMIIIKDACVALPRPAVVDHDEFPAIARHRRPPDLFNN